MGKFADDLAKFAQQTPTRAKLVVDKVAIDMLSRIVDRTPVGNPSLWKGRAPAGYVGGRLRGNWNTAIGQIDKTDRPRSKAGTAPKARGRATVAARVPDSDIYITNSLPYAQRIEFGYSTQTPAGMVRVTVAEFQGLFAKAARESNR